MFAAESALAEAELQSGLLTIVCRLGFKCWQKLNEARPSRPAPPLRRNWGRRWFETRKESILRHPAPGRSLSTYPPRSSSEFNNLNAATHVATRCDRARLEADRDSDSPDHY